MGEHTPPEDERHDFAKVNRQALQLTAASYLLVVCLAYPFLSAIDMARQFVVFPAITATAIGLLATYANRRDAEEIRYSSMYLGVVLNRIWLFFPVSIAFYACIVMLLNESYDGLRWIGPALGTSIGQQVADFVHARRQGR